MTIFTSQGIHLVGQKVSFLLLPWDEAGAPLGLLEAGTYECSLPTYTESGCCLSLQALAYDIPLPSIHLPRGRQVLSW